MFCNKKILIKKTYFYLITFFFISLLAFDIEADGVPDTIKTSQLLPLSSFTDNLKQEHRDYLGLNGKNKFTFKDIHGSILIIELFSTYCMSCPKNYPVLNSLYNYVENNKKLKDKVKIFGIAIGNSQEEVKEHINKYNLEFPIFTDYRFTFHKLIGSPRVPFTIIAEKISKNKYKVLFIHQGILDNRDIIIKNIPGHI